VEGDEEAACHSLPLQSSSLTASDQKSSEPTAQEDRVVMKEPSGPVKVYETDIL